MKIDGCAGNNNLISTIDECCRLLHHAKHCFNQSDIDAVSSYKRRFNINDRAVFFATLIFDISEVEIKTYDELNYIYDRFRVGIRSAHLNSQKSIWRRLYCHCPPDLTITKDSDYYAGVEICSHVLRAVFGLIIHTMNSLGNYGYSYYDELRAQIDDVEKFVVEELSEWNHTPADISDSKPGEIETSKKEQISDFIIKDKDRVLQFLDNELQNCAKPQGKLVAMLIIVLCDGGYFVHYSGKITAMIDAFRERYPGKVATNKGIEDYIRGYYNPNDCNPKRIPDEELKLLERKLN